MKKSDIDRFFKSASQKIGRPARIYLTGGILAWFYGGTRPTHDIDFALGTDAWREASEALKELSRKEGVPIEFSEDISRWGMVGYRNFTQGAKLYRTFGKIRVYLLDPAVWSVGKIGRFIESDLSDLLAVFRKQKPELRRTLKIWGAAVRESPKSSEQGLFVKKIEFFLTEYGKKIWGSSYDPEKTRKMFKEILLQDKRDR